jgi:hypothetical protein
MKGIFDMAVLNLSLLLAMDRILHIFESPKSCSNSQELPITNSRSFLRTHAGNYIFTVCFSDSSVYFNKTVLHIEKTSLSATEVVCEPKSLKTILQERKENCFIPHGGNYWYGN